MKTHFAHHSLLRSYVVSETGHRLSLYISTVFGVLTWAIQTSPYPFHHSPYPSDHRSYRSLCTLLQTLSPIRSNTRLRHSSRYILGTHACARSLHLYALSINCHSSLSPLRNLILLLPVRICKPKPEYFTPTADPRRNRVIFLTYSPSEILSTTSAHTFTQFGAIEWAYSYCVQCRAYSWRDNMAYSTWIGINSLCR